MSRLFLHLTSIDSETEFKECELYISYNHQGFYYEIYGKNNAAITDTIRSQYFKFEIKLAREVKKFINCCIANPNCFFLCSFCVASATKFEELVLENKLSELKILDSFIEETRINLDEIYDRIDLLFHVK
jgi:hypothetical protein